MNEMDFKIFLEKVEITLKKNNLFIDHIERIDSGKNSYAWKIKSRNKYFFLKLYKSNKNDNRDRIGAEYRFINLLKNLGKKNIPEVILLDQEEKWSLFKWINGKKIKKPIQKDWDSLLEFITSIQNLKQHKDANKIGLASEACFSLNEHYKLIKGRLNQLIKKTYGAEKIWLENEVYNSIKKYKSKFKTYFTEGYFTSHEIRILSPSDVGFHNILKVDNKFYYFDFEYSGWDDPYKLICDLIIQPENILPKDESICIFNKLRDTLDLGNNYDLLKIYINLYRAKWISIILNNLNHEKGLDKKFIRKSFNYYIKIGEIWQL